MRSLALILSALALLGSVASEAAQAIPLEEVAISLERSSPWPSSPAYRVVIRGNGLVFFEGRRSVNHLGPAGARVDTAAVVAIVNRFLSLHFFDLPAKYETREWVSLGQDGRLTPMIEFQDDGSDAVLCLRLGQREHSVLLHAFFPKELGDLAREVDTLGGTAAWIAGP